MHDDKERDQKELALIQELIRKLRDLREDQAHHFAVREKLDDIVYWFTLHWPHPL